MFISDNPSLKCRSAKLTPHALLVQQTRRMQLRFKRRDLLACRPFSVAAVMQVGISGVRACSPCLLLPVESTMPALLQWMI